MQPHTLSELPILFSQISIRKLNNPNNINSTTTIFKRYNKTQTQSSISRTNSKMQTTSSPSSSPYFSGDITFDTILTITVNSFKYFIIFMAFIFDKVLYITFHPIETLICITCKIIDISTLYQQKKELQREHDQVLLQLAYARQNVRNVEASYRAMKQKRDTLKETIKALQNELQRERGARYVVEKCHNEKIEKLEFELDMKEQTIINFEDNEKRLRKKISQLTEKNSYFNTNNRYDDDFYDSDEDLVFLNEQNDFDNCGCSFTIPENSVYFNASSRDGADEEEALESDIEDQNELSPLTVFCTEASNRLTQALVSDMAISSILMEFDDIITKCNISSSDCINIVLECFIKFLETKNQLSIPKCVEELFERYHTLLLNYIDSEGDQMHLLTCLENICTENAVRLQHHLRLLMVIYKVELVEPNVIIQWYHSGPCPDEVSQCPITPSINYNFVKEEETTSRHSLSSSSSTSKSLITQTKTTKTTTTSSSSTSTITTTTTSTSTQTPIRRRRTSSNASDFGNFDYNQFLKKDIREHAKMFALWLEGQDTSSSDDDSIIESMSQELEEEGEENNKMVNNDHTLYDKEESGATCKSDELSSFVIYDSNAVNPKLAKKKRVTFKLAEDEEMDKDEENASDDDDEEEEDDEENNSDNEEEKEIIKCKNVNNNIYVYDFEFPNVIKIEEEEEEEEIVEEEIVEEEIVEEEEKQLIENTNENEEVVEEVVEEVIEEIEEIEEEEEEEEIYEEKFEDKNNYSSTNNNNQLTNIKHVNLVKDDKEIINKVVEYVQVVC